ncbi:MAG: hypothetical protein ACK5LX_10865 [Oscillospiraceae bacterium]
MILNASDYSTVVLDDGTMVEQPVDIDVHENPLDFGKSKVIVFWLDDDHFLHYGESSITQTRFIRKEEF